jgi:hypothetical protein
MLQIFVRLAICSAASLTGFLLACAALRVKSLRQLARGLKR